METTQLDKGQCSRWRKGWRPDERGLWVETHDPASEYQEQVKFLGEINSTSKALLSP